MKRNQYNWRDRLALANLLWATKRYMEAQDQYQRYIKISDVLYIDPAKQMGQEGRRHVERRMTINPSAR